MPAAGFYPRGGGELDAWIEPAQLRPLTLTDRGPLLRIRGTAGVARLNPAIAERMRARAQARLAARGPRRPRSSWPTGRASPHVQGAALALTAESTHAPPATFVGLGERGKPAETVADEAVDELLAFLDAAAGAVDPHSADQILLPLALAPGRSEYTVTDVTEHLRTNAATIRAFLDRDHHHRGADRRPTRPGRGRLTRVGCVALDSTDTRGRPAAAGSPRLPPRYTPTRSALRRTATATGSAWAWCRGEGGVEDLGQDAAVHVVGDGDAEQVEDRRGDVEQGRLLRGRPRPERRAGGDQDAVHPVVAGRAERGGDEPVGREVVQADRPVPPVAEDDGQVGGEVGVRPVVQLVALVDPLDQRLRRSRGGGSRSRPGLEVVEQRADVRRGDAPLRLPALDVEEDLAEVPLRIGAGPRPVDMPPRQEDRLRQPLQRARSACPGTG